MKQLFKGEILTRAKTVNNILSYYNRATNEEKLQGKNWYLNANHFAHIMQQRYGYKHYQVIGVISALSPQTSWQQNKVIAEKFLNGEREGLHNNQQIYKAELCLNANEQDIFGILTKHGVKTSYFYANMNNPTEETGTTIDRHSLGVCIQKEPAQIQDSTYKMTKRQYEFFNECTTTAAKKLGLNSHQLQAITWTSYRRLKGLPTEYNVA